MAESLDLNRHNLEGLKAARTSGTGAIRRQQPGPGGPGITKTDDPLFTGAWHPPGYHAKWDWRVEVLRDGKLLRDISSMVTGMSWTEPRDSAIDTGAISWTEPKLSYGHRQPMAVGTRLAPRSGDEIIISRATSPKAPAQQVTRMRLREPQVTLSSAERSFTMNNDLINLQNSVDEFKFKKSKKDGKPKGWTVSEAIGFICKKYGINFVGTEANTRVTNMIVNDQRDVLSVINDLLKHEVEGKGRRFTLRFDYTNGQYTLFLGELRRNKRLLYGLGDELIDAVMSESFYESGSEHFATAYSIKSTPINPKTKTATHSEYKGPPLFTREGPQFYDKAYAHNSPFAQGAPYKTTLTGPQETAFRAWVAANNVPFRPDEDPTDYDMRGFYKASMIDNTIPDWTPGSHFPDTYKTPYDTTFSKESNYATGSCPFEWVEDATWGDLLIDTRDKKIVYGPDDSGTTKTKTVDKVDAEVQSDAAVARWGYVHRIVYVKGKVKSEQEAKKLALRHLAKYAAVKQSFQLTAPGIANLHKGDAIHLAIKDLGLHKVVWVAEIAHDVSATGHSMSLTCFIDNPYLNVKPDRVSEEQQANTEAKGRKTKKKPKKKDPPKAATSSIRDDKPPDPLYGQGLINRQAGLANIR